MWSLTRSRTPSSVVAVKRYWPGSNRLHRHGPRHRTRHNSGSRRRASRSTGSSGRIIDAQTGDDVYVGAGVDPIWSPDGSQLAFSRTEGDTQVIAVADADGGEILDLELPTGIRSVTSWIDPRLVQASP